jgi:hypothetical protein
MNLVLIALLALLLHIVNHVNQIGESTVHIKLVKLLFISTFLFYSNFGHSALTVTDYATIGDGLVIDDTISGLSWLHFDAANQTNDLNSLLNQYSGFTLATDTQLKTLWDSYLFEWTWDSDLSSVNTGPKYQQALDFQNIYG